MNPYDFVTKNWRPRPEGGERRHYGMRCSADIDVHPDGIQVTIYHVGRGGVLNRHVNSVFQERKKALIWAAGQAINIAMNESNWCGLNPEEIDAEYWDAIDEIGPVEIPHV
jgi:hypothetical protein